MNSLTSWVCFSPFPPSLPPSFSSSLTPLRYPSFPFPSLTLLSLLSPISSPTLSPYFLSSPTLKISSSYFFLSPSLFSFVFCYLNLLLFLYSPSLHLSFPFSSPSLSIPSTAPSPPPLPSVSPSFSIPNKNKSDQNDLHKLDISVKAAV